MKQLMLAAILLAFVCSCNDPETDIRNAKYIKGIEEKNNRLQRDLWKKEQLKNSDSAKQMEEADK